MPSSCYTPPAPAAQPRRCDIAVVRTTAMSHCRGCAGDARAREPAAGRARRAPEVYEAVRNVPHTPRLRGGGEPRLRWTFRTMPLHRRRVPSHEHDPYVRVTAAAGLRRARTFLRA